MKSFIAFGLTMLAMSESAATITVQAGEDFEAKCLLVVQPGDTCYLESGDYYHDGLTRTHGTKDKRITITGDSNACIKGSNTQDRALQIAHDYYTVEGLCFNGEHGDEYVATAIYVLGADYKEEKNGVTSSVTGFQMFDNHIKNFGSECVHFRYFVTHAEVSGNTIEHCGKEDFGTDGGDKVGEGIYVGTPLDQVDDNKTPETKLRSGSADNVDADVCAYNWIHHNTFKTYGNECVEIKEGSANNLIEDNTCEQQKDPKSGCFGSRGSDNTFRWNTIADCMGAGIRVGGEDGYGGGNNMYGNEFRDCDGGAFSVNAPDQGTVCENDLSGVDLISGGNYGDDWRDQFETQFSEAVATGGCSSYPGDLDGKSNTPSPAPESDDDDFDASGNDDLISEGDDYSSSDDDVMSGDDTTHDDDDSNTPSPAPESEDDDFDASGNDDLISEGDDLISEGDDYSSSDDDVMSGDDTSQDDEDSNTPSPAPESDDDDDFDASENDDVISGGDDLISEGDDYSSSDDDATPQPRGDEMTSDSSDSSDSSSSSDSSDDQGDGLEGDGSSDDKDSSSSDSSDSSSSDDSSSSSSDSS